jgi:two-component system, sensor histidine kinase YesM
LSRFKTLSIRTQLLMVVVVTGLILFSVVFFTYFQVTAMVVKNNADYTRDVLYQIDQRINDNCDLLEKIMRSVSFDSLVQDYMLEPDPYERYQIFYKMKPNFLNLVSIKEGILDLGVQNGTGTGYFVRGPNAAIQEHLDQMKDRRGFYYSGIVEIPYDNVDRRCFLLVSDIISVRSDATRGQVLGTAVVVFDASVLGIDPQSPIVVPESKLFLVDRNDLVFSSNDPARILSPLDPDVATNIAFGRTSIVVDGQKFVIHDAPISRFGGRIVSLVPENVLFGDLVVLRNLILGISLAASLLLLIFFSMLVRNILNPLNKFVRHLESIQTGSISGLRRTVGLTGYAEINSMALRFNGLLEEIDALTTRLLQTNSRMFELQLQQKKLEIAQLKKQINPHFLYNSLESMKGVALSEHAPTVFDMITALGRLYYYSFKGSDDVCVREELETILSYVRIQQVRFEERLQFSSDIPEEVMDCLIPKMILQPIVENAVFHGLEGKLEPGHLRIEGRIEGPALLRFRIIDDGQGIEPDVLAAIQRHLENESETANSSSDTSSGIGVMNVHSRIRLLYGAPYGLSVQSALMRGTTIVIDLPVRRNGDA